MPRTLSVIVGIGLFSFLIAGCAGKNTPSKVPKTPVVKEEIRSTLPEIAKQVDFTTENDAQELTRSGPVVYFFKASWCPTCQALQKELNSSIGSLPAGTSIITVDYDNSSALKTKYAVTYQHTLVQIDADGKELAKWQGGGVSEISRNIK